MAKDYKIESKNTIYNIRLHEGSYSDYSQYNEFIQANSEDEAWELFCRYYKSIGDTISIYSKKETKCLFVEVDDYEEVDGRRRYKGSVRTREYVPAKHGDPHFDSDWDSYRVEILKLNVICFKK
jgi:hypothetical protein